MSTDTLRTVSVDITTGIHHLKFGRPTLVSFAGHTFGELKERLAAVRLPGVGMGHNSFYEVFVGGRYLCMLDEEGLPAGDLCVQVTNYFEGLEWEKVRVLNNHVELSRQKVFTSQMPFGLSLDLPSYFNGPSGQGQASQSNGQPGCPHGPPRRPNWQMPQAPQGNPQAEGPPNQGQDQDHRHGPPHRGQNRGRSGEDCSKQRRRHSLERSPSPPSHRHAGHRRGRGRRHGSRSKSRGSSPRSMSPYHYYYLDNLRREREEMGQDIHHQGPGHQGRSFLPQRHEHGEVGGWQEV